MSATAFSFEADIIHVARCLVQAMNVKHAENFRFIRAYNTVIVLFLSLSFSVIVATVKNLKINTVVKYMKRRAQSQSVVDTYQHQCRSVFFFIFTLPFQDLFIYCCNKIIAIHTMVV